MPTKCLAVRNLKEERELALHPLLHSPSIHPSTIILTTPTIALSCPTTSPSPKVGKKKKKEKNNCRRDSASSCVTLHLPKIYCSVALLKYYKSRPDQADLARISHIAYSLFSLQSGCRGLHGIISCISFIQLHPYFAQSVEYIQWKYV